MTATRLSIAWWKSRSLLMRTARPCRSRRRSFRIAAAYSAVSPGTELAAYNGLRRFARQPAFIRG